MHTVVQVVYSASQIISNKKDALKMGGVKLSINLYPFELLDAMVINNHTVWSVFYG
ncbi:hypothetical protein XBKB1_1820006 [Xenorhabdus bovienii str. kraussei Becker Underwood]|uniref:Uncharacterized protein n=1 Tax=Xenorhabdus bovienii str. kraussei Becker Underwood TaxID=1398204 RepID=A0A077PUJ1_XENBV|nr:hypothetical protein XBKB1_1820006 [Xenorhabdus bovienii str. kraussei Becker Underwood]